jgi:hypothetical protein
MKKTVLFLLLFILVLIPSSVFAQSYYFTVEKETVHVFWESDGTMDLIYEFVFYNQPGSHVIDYVDVGLPNYNYSDSNISADINGQAMNYISSSGYEGTGSGVAVGLGSNAIAAGSRGTVRVFVNGIEDVLFPDTEEDEYASAVFEPTYFGSQYVEGTTDITVIFHLPPGVQPDEPRWHSSPAGFSSTPITGMSELRPPTITWPKTVSACWGWLCNG